MPLSQDATTLITGGAGFIGGHMVRALMADGGGGQVVSLDKMTYASTRDVERAFSDNPRFAFEQVDLAEAGTVHDVVARHRPDSVIHLAAESHVDRSIDAPAPFIESNVVGTHNLLEACRRHWNSLDAPARENFRFLHASTDEVYGALGAEGAFTETTAYDPRSPYSASKAASDFLARAWRHTYGIPVVVTNSSNNYGPYQFPEKLIPLSIISALRGQPIRVYGDGGNVRDWIHVEDHVAGILAVLQRGRPGETYLVGGAGGARSNLEVVHAICDLLDALSPRKGGSHRDLVTFVADRPGHDFRYAIDSSKLAALGNWRPRESFETGLRKTVQWYIDNTAWWETVMAKGYGGERLGLARPAVSRGGTV